MVIATVPITSSWCLAALPQLIYGFLLEPWGRVSLALFATGLFGLAVIVIAANTARRGIPRTDDWKSYDTEFFS